MLVVLNDPLQPVRDRILSTLLGAMAGLGGLAYVPSMWLSLSSGPLGYAIGVVDTLVYGAVILLWWKPSLGYRVRASALVALFYGLSVALTVIAGGFGAGLLWLLASSVTTAVLLGARAVRVALIGTTTTLIAIGAWVVYSPPIWASVPGWTIANWIVLGANFVFLDVALTMSVSVVFQGLAQAMQAVEDSRCSLENQREHLEQIKAEVELQTRHRALVERRAIAAERYHAVGTLAAGVAHDINNVLAPIVAYTDLARLSTTDEELEDALTEVERGAKRASDLVQRILAFGHDAELAPQWLCLDEFIRETMRLVRATLSPSVRIDEHLETGCRYMFADPVQVQRLFVGLFSQAEHGMPEGGTVTLRTVLDEQGTVRLTMTAAAHGFAEGTGFDVTRLRDVAAALEGRISASISSDSGAEVELWLPTHHSPALRDSERAHGKVPSELVRVLVVDDDDAVGGAHARLLEAAGFVVDRVNDGEAGLAMLRRRLATSDPVRILLSDISMPGMDGFELVRLARAIDASLHVIFVTGVLTAEIKSRVTDATIPLLPKPVTSGDLVQVCRVAVESSKSPFEDLQPIHEHHRC